MPATEPGAHDTTVLLHLQQKMIEIREADPEWFAQYEDRDPITADSETLRSMLDSAPNEFAGGLIVGFIIFRQQLAILTGRPF